MAKFAAIGRHGPVDAVDREFMARSRQWLADALDGQGPLEAAYAMSGGGRLVLGTAASSESFVEYLSSAVDLERDWEVWELTEAVDALDAYLATLDPES